MEKRLLFSLSKANGDFVVKTSRSSGSGGQNVNKRDTKVRIEHPASGAVAVCQTHRTQEANKREAFRRLVAKPEFQKWINIEAAHRGVPERVQHQRQTERIRTYHKPRGTVTDHRTGVVAKYDDVLDGKLDVFMERGQ